MEIDPIVDRRPLCRERVIFSRVYGRLCRDGLVAEIPALEGVTDAGRFGENAVTGAEGDRARTFLCRAAVCVERDRVFVRRPFRPDDRVLGDMRAEIKIARSRLPDREGVARAGRRGDVEHGGDGASVCHGNDEIGLPIFVQHKCDRVRRAGCRIIAVGIGAAVGDGGEDVRRAVLLPNACDRAVYGYAAEERVERADIRTVFCGERCRDERSLCADRKPAKARQFSFQCRLKIDDVRFVRKRDLQGEGNVSRRPLRIQDKILRQTARRGERNAIKRGGSEPAAEFIARVRRHRQRDIIFHRIGAVLYGRRAVRDVGDGVGDDGIARADGRILRVFFARHRRDCGA